MNIQSVLSLAPLRVSFLGGGTDISSFYARESGAVVSAAINKYVYVHVKRHDLLFQEKYRISYSDVEHTQERNQIKNLIVKACLELLEMDEPLQISTSADLPANSGLGSSSSFAVALLHALHVIRGENVSQVQLAEEACHVEIELLNSPIGKQDQYAAAFGGLNFFEFSTNSSVRIDPLYTPHVNPDRLLNQSILIWTGQTRNANSVLADQASRTEVNFSTLLNLKELALEFKSELLQPELNWGTLGELIKQGWHLKMSLSEKITNQAVHSIISDLISLNCAGYKLLGAGGGGFVYALVDDPLILNQIESRSWSTFRPRLDHSGTRIVSVS